MSNDQRGTAHRQIVKGPLDFGLRYGVQGRSCFVQNQNRRIFQENPCNGHTLFLTAGQKGTAFAHVGVKAIGHRHNIFVNLCFLCRFHDFVHGCIGLSVADILKNRIRKEEDILLHNADAFVDALLGHIPDVQSVNPDGTGGNIVKPGNQLAQGGLAAAGRTYNGDGLTGLNLQIHFPQHIQVTLVGKGNILHGNLTPDIFQHCSVGLVLNGRICAHHLYKPSQTRKTVGKHFREAAEFSHGIDKGCNIQIKGNQIPIVHLALHHIISAKTHHNHVQAAQEKFHAAVELTHGFVKFLLGSLKGIVGSIESAAFGFLIGKRLGSPETGQAAFNFLVDVADLFLGSRRSPAHTLAHGHHHNQENRNGQSHHQSQLPPDGNHHNQSAADGQHRRQQVFRTMVGQFCQLKQIRSQPGHELSRTVPIIKIKTQFLHMSKQVLADIRFHPDAEGMAVIGHNEVQHGPQHIAANHHRHDGKECPVHLVGQQVIEGASGNQRKRQVNGGNAHSTADVQCKKLLVIFEILQENQ